MDTPADLPMNNVLVPLRECAGLAVGGKAAGLATLMNLGLAVPDGFIIQNATKALDSTALAALYRQMSGAKVAVRSSALGEDTLDTSFAGQYETVLNVEGMDQLLAAIHHCIESRDVERAKVYRADHDVSDVPMNVVVQRMVDAQCAGVLFTADPVSARRDLVIIDATVGLAESLVSGEVTPDHYVLSHDGELLDQECVGAEAILRTRQLEELCDEALRVHHAFGVPVDMEWAIDGEGKLFWLQARPITTLPADLNELETGILTARDVLTRCNIGEMMPGAIDPLTFSTSGWVIEHSLQYLHCCYGIADGLSRQFEQICYAWGRLFMNLSTYARAEAHLLAVPSDQMAIAICGRVVPELKAPPKRPVLRRLVNFFRLLRSVWAIPTVIVEAQRMVGAAKIERHSNSRDMWEEIEAKFPLFERVSDCHTQSSTGSGFAAAVLEKMIRKSFGRTGEEAARVAVLLAGAEKVESAMLVDDLGDIVDELLSLPNSDEVAQMSTQALAEFLSSPDAQRAGRLFSEFLRKYGHRGYRELSMRDPSWGDDPLPLVSNVRLAVAAKLKGIGQWAGGPGTAAKRVPLGMRPVLRYAHEAVRRREQTKSLFAKIGHEFKKAYRHLSTLLVEEGHLPEADLIYFYTRAELADFIERPDPATVVRAQGRRRALAYQEKLQFPEVCVGRPQPLIRQATGGAGKLIGRPVSAGVVEGLARVARSPAEASAVEPGEILVAPITDVGWTPYFRSIAGLATDLGSAVSHGAVIAREYGLPCVVNLRTATQEICTGERVRLDADRGVLERIGERPSHKA